jgi:type I restriction enzyme S subunit
MATDFATDGIPLLRIAGIGRRTATLDGCNYLSPDLVHRRWEHFRVRSGDLLISGSASTGFCSEVDAEVEGAVPYTGIIIIRPRVNTTEKGFLRWFFLSESFLTQTELARSGSAIQHFGPSHLSRMHIMVPPLPEQSAIAAFLDRETARIDALVAKVRDAIERLKELRTALISAAVTGKIDVREEVAA